MKKASPQTDRVEVTSLHGFIYENAARCPVGAALFIVVIMFISQYSAEYGLIMAASVVALIPVLIVFLSLQKYFVQGVASSGLKG